MRWILILVGVAAVAVLLFWMSDDAGARRTQRDQASTAPSIEKANELGEEEREEDGALVTLLGIVVNEEEEPIVGAGLEVVRKKGAERETATTDGAGQFRLAARPLPYLAVQARHPDYVTGVGDSRAAWHLRDVGLEQRNRT